jgi:hypothetical protein
VDSWLAINIERELEKEPAIEAAAASINTKGGCGFTAPVVLVS